MKEHIREALTGRAAAVLDGPALVPSAVIVPVFSKGSADHLLFTRRTDHVARHKGQISFPGGVRERGDPDLLATALREMQEEIGVSPADVEVLGPLDQVSTRQGFAISPFVATIPFPYDFRPDPHEVAELLEVPLEFFLDHRYVREERDADGRTTYYYDYNSHVIWGATASIVRQLVHLVFPRSSEVSAWTP